MSEPSGRELVEANYRRLEAERDALAAQLTDRTKASEQLAAIGQSQFDRIRDLEKALRKHANHDWWNCDSVKVQADEFGYDTGKRLPCSCGWAEAQLLLTPAEIAVEPEIDQAPIALLIVLEDDPPDVVLYAPGLPPGEFDVYLEPSKKAQPVTEPNVCPTCRGRGGSVIDRHTGKTVYFCNCDPPECNCGAGECYGLGRASKLERGIICRIYLFIGEKAATPSSELTQCDGEDSYEV